MAYLNEKAKADLPDHPAYVGGNRQLMTEEAHAELKNYPPTLR